MVDLSKVSQSVINFVNEIKKMEGNPDKIDSQKELDKIGEYLAGNSELTNDDKAYLDNEMRQAEESMPKRDRNLGTVLKRIFQKEDEHLHEASLSNVQFKDVRIEPDMTPLSNDSLERALQIVYSNSVAAGLMRLALGADKVEELKNRIEQDFFSHFASNQKIETIDLKTLTEMINKDKKFVDAMFESMEIPADKDSISMFKNKINEYKEKYGDAWHEALQNDLKESQAKGSKLNDSELTFDVKKDTEE